jgi:LemA protein
MRLMLAALAMTMLSACGLNSVPRAEEEAKARWADVENQYQRRADLIPNLVAVTQARSGALRTTLSADQLGDPARVAAFERAQGAVTVSLQRLQEAYPDLQSQRNYVTLMSQMEGTENRISVARADYNKAVQAYNTRIRTFPDSIGASMIHGAKPLVPFRAVTEGAEVAPKADFD